MKKIIQILSLFLFILSQNLFAQEDYDEWDNSLEIVYENLFNGNMFSEEIITSEGLLTSFQDGYVELKAPEVPEEFSIPIDLTWTRDLQIEFEMKFVGGYDYVASGIDIEYYNFDFDEVALAYTSFGITANQKYLIYDVAEIDGDHYLIQDWKESRYINHGEFNKYTIRKTGDFVCYFINEVLIKKTDRGVKEGNFLNIFCGEGSTIAIDRVSVAYKK